MSEMQKPFDRSSETPFFRKPAFLAWGVIATIALLILIYFVA